MARRSHGNAGVALAAIALLASQASFAAASWGQQGGDAGRSGVADASGPSWGDVALRSTLRFGQIAGTLPVVVGDEAFVLGVGASGGYVVQAISLSTGEARIMEGAAPAAGSTEEPPPPASGIVVDETDVLVVSSSGVEAWTLDGAPRWTWPSPRALQGCVPPALSSDLLVVSCPIFGPPSWACSVFAIDRASGELRWELSADATSDAAQSRAASECVPIAVTLGESSLYFVSRTRLTAPYTTGIPARVIVSVAALDLATGAEEWREILTSGVAGPGDAQLDIAVAPPPAFVATPVAAAAGRIFTNIGGFSMFDETGTRLWSDEGVDTRPSGGLVLRESDAYAATGEGIYRFAADGNPMWFEIPEGVPGEEWAPAGLALAGGSLFAMTKRPEPAASRDQTSESYRLRAFDAGTGRERWSIDLPPMLGPLPLEGPYDFAISRYSFALADDALVLTDDAGDVIVVGRTGASMLPRVAASTTAPGLREEFTADLAGTSPGRQGSPDEFAVDWGDGTRDEWQASPVFSHAYGDVGDFPARFSVRNDKGTSASEVVVFTVGAGGDRLPSAWWALLVLPLVAVAVAASTRARRREIDSPTPAFATPGSEITKYALDRKLGVGTFGEVWLATDKRLGRKVVVKQLHPQWSEPGEARERFEREARILASLDHPNVTRVHDVDLTGRPFIVMEYVDGGSLDALLARGPLGVEDAARITLEMLEGLDAIHAAGVIHRDLKPSNVLLTRGGRVKLADFGVARIVDPERSLTIANGPPIGTPLYMAREQLSGGAGDARSDLYAVGAVFYRSVAGRSHLGGRLGDLADVERAHDAPYSTAIASAPPALNAWLARALDSDSARRFASAREMAAALRAAVAAL